MIEPPHRIKGRRPYLNDDLLDVAIPTLVAQRDDITFGVNCRIISTCLTRPYRPKAYWFIQSITIHPGQTKHKQKYEPHSKPGTNQRLYLPILCQEKLKLIAKYSFRTHNRRSGRGAITSNSTSSLAFWFRYNPNGESNGFTLRQLKPTSSRSIHPVHDKLFRPIHRANKRQP
ncbi:hypothetical protein PGTUg99_025256 [Puccinia graminis f. sp. tritici]|uniref:Uncharacterized protein n=1 Tax=Puccinia graminis f. sp. tritici TaxID=56615 RepID=A0A5B0PHR4_PUCGR|nr:hypothetical protein PGTUg99_025256 [Puccinia graminis f. sp. tritici]